jgi:hypothetical protein
VSNPRATLHIAWVRIPPLAFIYTPVKPSNYPVLTAKITEKVGFEPTVETSPTQPFQGCSLSHSDTSPAG